MASTARPKPYAVASNTYEPRNHTEDLKMNFATPALLAITALPFAATAYAADLRAPVYSKAPIIDPAYNWSGIYVGVNAGGIWGEGTNQLSPSAFNPGVIVTTTPLKSSSFAGGGQFGTNYQLGKLVLGFEADISYASLHESGSSTGVSTITTTGETKLDWFGTVRGRAGFATTDNLLIYGTGGLAFADVKYSGSIMPFNPTCGPDVCYAGDTSRLKAGWVAGAGFEYALLRNWSAKAEYLRYDLGAITNVLSAIPGPSQPFTSSTDITGNIVRVGLNYKFQQ